jgi:hypothetical protein
MYSPENGQNQKRTAKTKEGFKRPPRCSYACNTGEVRKRKQILSYWTNENEFVIEKNEKKVAAPWREVG